MTISNTINSGPWSINVRSAIGTDTVVSFQDGAMHTVQEFSGFDVEEFNSSTGEWTGRMRSTGSRVKGQFSVVLNDGNCVGIESNSILVIAA